jgi:arsenate reductase
MLAQTNLVVTVCGHADEHCPVLPPGTRREHWPLEDPAKAEIDFMGDEERIMQQFRASRDDISQRIKELLERLKESES